MLKICVLILTDDDGSGSLDGDSCALNELEASVWGAGDEPGRQVARCQPPLVDSGHPVDVFGRIDGVGDQVVCVPLSIRVIM